MWVESSPADAQLFAHLLVVVLGECFCGFNAQAVQVEIFGVLPCFEQPLRLNGRLRADRHERQAENIHLSGRLWHRRNLKYKACALRAGAET